MIMAASFLSYIVMTNSSSFLISVRIGRAFSRFCMEFDIYSMPEMSLASIGTRILANLLDSDC